MTASRRTFTLVTGVVIVVLGLVTAGGLWYIAGQRLDDNVAGFARAPSGCATTLDFDRTGRFTLYVETQGRLDDVAGDCAVADTYDRDEVPEPALTLLDADGGAVEIQPDDTTSYDTGTFLATSTGVVDISRTGEHVLTVASDGPLFAVAVGGDPDAGVAPLRWGAVVVALAALLIGGLLLVVGSRKPPAQVTTPSVFDPPGWPTAPPGFPVPPPTTGATGPPVAPGPPAAAVEPPVAGPPSGPASWAPPSVSSGA